MQELEFYALIDRAYRWFPPAHERDSIGIDLPNAHYDRTLGQQVINEVVQMAQRAERLGFDAVSFFEQHNTPLALLPNALTAAAHIGAKTEGIQIAPIGPIINAYQSPVRLAEEIALVDNMLGGRLTVGLPLGIGAQYHSYGVMDPLTARGRYHEGIALMEKIWAEDGPFAWEGEHFHIPYVNPWPKPIQQPHPEIFIPGAGSRETIELAAKYDYTYQVVLVPMPTLIKNTQLFRDLREEHGHPEDRRKIAAVLNIYVAETDEQARAELERHIVWTVQNIIRFQFHESFPPGSVSEPSFRGMMASGYRSTDPSDVDADWLFRDGTLFGSPETVRERLAEITETMGAGRVLVGLQSGMPMWLHEKSMTLFAEEVIPHFRAPGAQPVWRRQPAPGIKTNTEIIGRTPHRAGQMTVGYGGEYVPVTNRAAD